jgi:drug/metabolite transporter superfamily protein YnfA
MWFWATLIALLGLFNVWHWITGTSEDWVGMVGAIAVLSVFLLLLVRFGFLVRRNRSAADRTRP